MLCEFRVLMAVAVLLCLAQLASAQPMQGKVVGVHDGDTLTVLVGRGDRLRIRLAEIDAPELGQPFGQASKRSLSDLCFGKVATVVPKSIDRYKRIVALVFCEGSEANQQQLARGMAWVYQRYLKRSELVAYEAGARKQKLGLWSEDGAVEPWRWRRSAAKDVDLEPSD